MLLGPSVDFHRRKNLRLLASRLTAIGLLVCSLVSPPAGAQTAYPTKPITIVVGYPPGGSTDLTGRTLAAELAKHLGATVVIDNVGGAGGVIGAQKVANAAPDGYTLLVGANNEVAIAKLVSASVKYDVADFTPLGLIASQPMVLVASQKSAPPFRIADCTPPKPEPGGSRSGWSPAAAKASRSGNVRLPAASQMCR